MVSFDHRDPGTPEAVWRNSAELSRAPELDLEDVDRAVVFAAHPDDETLGAGGTIHRLARRGVRLRIVVATLGENSHPDSPTHTPEALARLRHDELRAAIAALAADSSPEHVRLEYLRLPDGRLTREALDEPVGQAVAWAAEGRHPLVVSTWAQDGHPDHEVLAETVREASGHRGLRCVQYPVWWWHWGTPADLPFGLVRVPLTRADRAAKRDALGHHVSQTRPLSPRPGDEVLLGPHVLEHFDRDREFFVVTAPHQAPVFDRVHTESEDPWRVDSSAYERRKRDVLLACLPAEHYERALDIGCSTGALTQRLAARTGRLTAVDASGVALDRARARLRSRGADEVELRRAVLPEHWDETWRELDLIVVSEVGYFCSPEQWERLLELCVRALSPAGHLVLCHWRHPIEDWPLDGEDVHALARRHRGLERVVAHREADFELEIFTRRTRERA